MAPAEGNVLTAIADTITKAGQFAVSLIRRQCHRVAKEIASIDGVIRTKGMINLNAELVVIAVQFRSDHKIVIT